MLTCLTCKLCKPPSEFHRNRSSKTGYHRSCKLCRKPETAKYIETHKEEILTKQRAIQPLLSQAYHADPDKKAQVSAYNKQYSIANKEKIKTQRHQHYLENKNVLNARSTEGHRKNPEKRRARFQRYYIKNKDIHNQRVRAWQISHPEEVRRIAIVSESRKRARAKNDPQNDFDATQLKVIFDAYDSRCVYCPPDCIACAEHAHEMTHDHIIARAIGGPNTASNVVPACKSCNSKKGIGPPPIPMDEILSIHPYRQQT